MGLARNPAQIPMRSYGRCQLSSCISTYHQHTITAVVVDCPLCDSSIHTVVECRVYLCERLAAALGCEKVARRSSLPVASELADSSRPEPEPGRINQASFASALNYDW